MVSHGLLSMATTGQQGVLTFGLQNGPNMGA
jgi:hypothetical protein